jgi:hypothetical protein
LQFGLDQEALIFMAKNGLKDRMVKVQTTLVACPRNQFSDSAEGPYFGELI